ncbi:MAG: cyclodeaminase/cyclohydrolase family protein [Deltaproteobacteria bacterium]|nr:cyclodeaminase/cyclohydrolase family protein [Deltaproteobacteria bacterium]
MLADLSIRDFLAETASGQPVPGGGSVAALSAAAAAGLAEMVANLTIGKKGFEDREGEMGEIAREASGCRDKLLGDIDRDSEAYQGVLQAFRMPRGTEGEKQTRKEAVQAALKHAASVPLAVAGDAFRVMDLAGRALEKGNPNAVTDAAVAVMMARTAVLSAIYNVRINLASITDRDFVRDLSDRVNRLERDVNVKEGEMLSRVRI